VFGGVDVRPDGVELQPQRPIFALKHRRQRHHRHMPAPLQFQRNRDQRIDVAQRADIRENDAP
jgi:hypothetical protein